MTLIALPETTAAPLPKAPLALPSAAPSRRRAAVRDLAVAHRGSRVATIAGHVVLVAMSAAAVLPIAWMYLGSFRPPDQVLSAGLFSTHFSLGNYSTAISTLPVAHLLWNTTAVAVGVSAGQLLSGLLAAYAFARWSFRGEKLLFFAIVATWLVPFQVTMIPNYVALSRLGLLNSIGGVIVPQLASAFAVLLLRQHLKAFPTDLLDAARVDGQSSFVTLFRVVIPSLGPSLAALGILLFVSQWNEYFWPLLVFHVPDSVLQIAIQNFLAQDSTNYGALMAASGLACLPIFVLYIVLQRRVVNAFVRSGLK